VLVMAKMTSRKKVTSGWLTVMVLVFGESVLVKKWHSVSRKSLMPAQTRDTIRGHGLVN